MSVSGIQVVGCTKLKDTEWVSRQDPYVCVEYGSNNCRTRTCTDGGKNPTFQEKFMFTLIEGLREISVGVWNSNTLSFDDFIGNGKVQLHKVLSQGFDDTTWPLQTKTGRYSGEVKLIMHYANANKAATGYAPSAPPCVYPDPRVSQYYLPPPAQGTPRAQPPTTYPAPYPYPSCLPAPYPYPSYPPSSAFPQSAYPPPQPTPYPPAPYPACSACPPPPQASPYYPPGPFFGTYPPPPY